MNKINSQNFIGKIFGSWEVLTLRKHDEYNPIYCCKCKNCDFQHVVSHTNIISNIACQTCPSKSKAPMADVVDLFGGMLGLDANKKNEIADAFDKLNQPEFKEVYGSLERSSKIIQDLMRPGNNSSDIARKVLEVEGIKLKEAFGNLIKNGKITEEEAKSAKAEINSSTNIEKLKSMLSTMKIQQNVKKV